MLKVRVRFSLNICIDSSTFTNFSQKVIEQYKSNFIFHLSNPFIYVCSSPPYQVLGIESRAINT